ncbi:hypothetical protein HDU85_006329 [Gaertneriomyces sp. JEL0708]|nr:hypothetical protein HDU85_006329 [Gaertneriomyces sp. JEL0708]
MSDSNILASAPLDLQVDISLPTTDTSLRRVNSPSDSTLYRGLNPHQPPFCRQDKGRSFVRRPRVNPASPLASVVGKSVQDPVLQGLSPICSTALITDIVFAVALYRSILILSAGPLNWTTIFHYLLVFLPLHTTYVLFILEHDRSFARRDLLHFVYTAVRIGIIFISAFTAPTVFSAVHPAWRPFATSLLVARGLYAISNVAVALYEPRSTKKAWWMISFRAAGVLAPCVLWIISLAVGENNLHLRDVLWACAAVVEQAYMFGLGLFEGQSEDRTVSAKSFPETAVALERRCYQGRLGIFTALLVGYASAMLFDTARGVGLPDKYVAIPFYFQNLLAGVGAVVALYALERLYHQVNPYLSITMATAPSMKGPGPLDVTVEPISSSSNGSKRERATMRFAVNYLHLPMHAALLIAVYGLQLSVAGIYLNVRNGSSIRYLPPTSTSIMNHFSGIMNSARLAARQGSVPYGMYQILENPTMNAASKLGETSIWTPQQLFSIGSGVVIVCLALMDALQFRGRSRRWHGAIFLGRIIIALGTCIPAMLDATVLPSFISVCATLVAAAVLIECVAVRL